MSVKLLCGSPKRSDVNVVKAPRVLCTFGIDALVAMPRNLFEPGRMPSLSFSPAHEVRDLSALSSSVRVRLVQHESDDSIIPSLEPSSRRVEDRTLNRADEHVLKHRVIP